MAQGQQLQLELHARPNAGPKGGAERDQQGSHRDANGNGRRPDVQGTTSRAGFSVATGAGSAFDDGLDSAECLVGGQLEFREFSRGQRANHRLERRSGNGAHLKREGHGIGG